jgi:hypothetical protein
MNPTLRSNQDNSGSQRPGMRKAVASLRIELGPPRLPWAAAPEVERRAQLWSLHRRASQ